MREEKWSRARPDCVRITREARGGCCARDEDPFYSASDAVETGEGARGKRRTTSAAEHTLLFSRTAGAEERTQTENETEINRSDFPTRILYGAKVFRLLRTDLLASFLCTLFSIIILMRFIHRDLTSTADRRNQTRLFQLHLRL